MTSEKIPYISVIGASYSGSTLLAFLLNAHPRIVSISEMGLAPGVSPETYRCSCRSPLLECPFFLEVERRINTLGSTFNLTDWQTNFQISEYRLVDICLARPLKNVLLETLRDRVAPAWPGYKGTVEVISRRVANFAQAAIEISGKEVFADTKKDPIRTKFLQANERLDLKVIHLVRDVRGAVASVMKNRGKDDLVRAIRFWYSRNMDAERARQYVSSRQWMRLSYEDLCGDPQGVMDRIADFVGVRHASIPRDFYQTEHHMIGNHMRLNNGYGSVKRDESWRNRLTDRDLQTIVRLAGRANRYFGHEWP